MSTKWPTEVEIPEHIGAGSYFTDKGEPWCTMGHIRSSFRLVKAVVKASEAFKKCARATGVFGCTGEDVIVLNDWILDRKERLLCYKAMLEYLDYDTGDKRAAKIAEKAKKL